MDPQIKFIMESSGDDGSIHFLDTECLSKEDHSMHPSAYRKPTQTDHYLGWNSNNPISTRKSVIHTLIYRDKSVFSTPGILTSEMDYLWHDLLNNNYH